MTYRKLIQPFRINEKLSLLLNQAIVILMMGCFGVAGIIFVRRFLPSWQGVYLPWMCILVCIESMYSWRLTRRMTDLNADTLVFHITEWVVLLVCVKIFLYIWSGINQLWVDLIAWRNDFLAAFFSPEYLGVCLLLILVWGLARMYASDLDDLSGDTALLVMSEQDGYRSDRSAIRRHLVGRVLFVGFVIVLLTALAQVDFMPTGIAARPSRFGLIVVMSYFLLSFILLSQSQFAILRASWVWERVSISTDMAKRWTVFSLIFLSVIALIAFLLPTHYSLGFLATLGYLFDILISGVAYVLGFFLVLLSIPFYYLANLMYRLFGSLSGLRPLAAPILPEVPRSDVLRQPIPWWEFAKSLLFWGIFIVVVGYAFYQYLNQNQELINKLRRLRVWRWIAQTWKMVWEQFQGVNQHINAFVKRSLERLRPQYTKDFGSPPWGYINLRQLPPRERIRFFYLAMVRRGRERGLPRHHWQTPNEYRRTLETQYPQSEADLSNITESFILARYSQQEVTPTDASRVRETWERIRKMLRGRR
jgi:hypothetical protein